MDGTELKRVLVIDDEEIFRNLLEKTLSLEGYIVDKAEDGAEGIALIEERKYGVILTDLMMPKAGGIEVLKAAKRNDPQSAVIIITGYASLDSALAAIREGAYDYITKPFQLEEIKLTVSNAYTMRSLLSENERLMQSLQQAYRQINELLEGKSEYSDRLKDINQELDKRQKEIFDGVQVLKKKNVRGYKTESSLTDIHSLLNLRRLNEGTDLQGKMTKSS